MRPDRLRSDDFIRMAPLGNHLIADSQRGVVRCQRAHAPKRAPQRQAMYSEINAHTGNEWVKSMVEAGVAGVEVSKKRLEAAAIPGIERSRRLRCV